MLIRKLDRMSDPVSGQKSALAVAIALAAASCGEGGLRIHLDLPDDPELSPTAAGEVAEVALTTRSPGGERQRLSRSGDGAAGLELGSLAPGAELRLAVELVSGSQRLLGYGGLADPVAVSAGADLEIAINVRRPLLYVAGNPEELASFDAHADGGEGPIRGAPLGAVTAAASSADGASIVAVTDEGDGGRLAIISTATHEIEREVASVGPRAADVAIAGGGRAVIAHRSAVDGSEDGGVTIVELATGEAIPVRLGDVRRVVIDSAGEVAYALVDAALTCSTTAPAASQIVEIGLADPETPRALAWSGPAAALAIDPESGALHVADPCRGVMTLAPGDAEPTLLFELAAASAIAIREGAVIAAGNAEGSPPRLAVVTRALASGETRVVELPALQERAVSLDFDDTNQRVEMVADADAVTAIDLAVIPGSERVAVITASRYEIEAVADEFFELIPDMDLTGWELQVIDGGGTLVQRVRSLCDLDVEIESNTVLIDWRCGVAPGQVIPALEFEPRGLDGLFGAP
jgi:hypothetical protein